MEFLRENGPDRVVDKARSGPDPRKYGNYHAEVDLTRRWKGPTAVPICESVEFLCESGYDWELKRAHHGPDS